MATMKKCWPVVAFLIKFIKFCVQQYNVEHDWINYRTTLAIQGCKGQRGSRITMVTTFDIVEAELARPDSWT